MATLKEVFIRECRDRSSDYAFRNAELVFITSCAQDYYFQCKIKDIEFDEKSLLENDNSAIHIKKLTSSLEKNDIYLCFSHVIAINFLPN